jgi:hypothetical protein
VAAAVLITAVRLALVAQAAAARVGLLLTVQMAQQILALVVVAREVQMAFNTMVVKAVQA